jgi:hypothetical protein
MATGGAAGSNYYAHSYTCNYDYARSNSYSDTHGYAKLHPDGTLHHVAAWQQVHKGRSEGYL